jgi:hypothetical protein
MENKAFFETIPQEERNVNGTKTGATPDNLRSQPGVNVATKNAAEKIFNQYYDTIMSQLNYSRTLYLKEIYKNKQTAQEAISQFKQEEYIKEIDEQKFNITVSNFIDNLSVSDKHQRKRILDDINQVIQENSKSKKRFDVGDSSISTGQQTVIQGGVAKMLNKAIQSTGLTRLVDALREFDMTQHLLNIITAIDEDFFTEFHTQQNDDGYTQKFVEYVYNKRDDLAATIKTLSNNTQALKEKLQGATRVYKILSYATRFFEKLFSPKHQDAFNSLNRVFDDIYGEIDEFNAAMNETLRTLITTLFNPRRIELVNAQQEIAATGEELAAIDQLPDEHQAARIQELQVRLNELEAKLKVPPTTPPPEEGSQTSVHQQLQAISQHIQQNLDEIDGHDQISLSLKLLDELKSTKELVAILLSIVSIQNNVNELNKPYHSDTRNEASPISPEHNEAAQKELNTLLMQLLLMATNTPPEAFNSKSKERARFSVDIKGMLPIVSSYTADTVDTKARLLESFFRQLYVLMKPRSTAPALKPPPTNHQWPGLRDDLNSIKPPTQVPMPGGSPEQIEKAKQMRAKIDGVRKILRGITDGLEGIRIKYKNFTDLHSTINNEQVDNLYDKVDLITSEFDNISNDQTINPENKKSKLASLEKKVLGLDASIKDIGDKTEQEVSKFVNDAKEQLAKVLSTMIEIYEDIPGNATYVKRIGEWKSIIEGDYTNETDVALPGLLDLLKTNIISEYSTVKTKVSTIASGIREANQKEVAMKQADNNYRRPQGYYGGAAKTVFEIIANIKDIIIKRLQKDFLPEIDQEYLRRSNPVMASALGNEPNLFSNIYQSYLDTKNNKTQAAALDDLSIMIESNKMVPSAVLAITPIDKVVFVATTLIVRLLALNILEQFLSRGWVSQIVYSLLLYVVFYTAVMICVIALVNLDVYKLRIVFNYMNFHANGGLIIMHIAMLWFISMLFMIMIWNNVMPMKGVDRRALDEEGRMEIMYRLEVLSLIIWIFLVVMIVLM